MGLRAQGAYFLGLKVGRRSAEVILIDFLGQVKHRDVETYAYPDPDVIQSFARTAIDGTLAAKPAIIYPARMSMDGAAQ